MRTKGYELVAAQGFLSTTSGSLLSKADFRQLLNVLTATRLTGVDFREGRTFTDDCLRNNCRIGRRRPLTLRFELRHVKTSH